MLEALPQSSFGNQVHTSIARLKKYVDRLLAIYAKYCAWTSACGCPLLEATSGRLKRAANAKKFVSKSEP